MCLISFWNKKQNWKSYLPANKHSGFDLNLSSHNNLKTVALLDVVFARGKMILEY